ncbi:hypothetical protein TCAL_16575 [Tigriopus californicus]|uniref:Uncharacterized protein n=1 Tax=Tigriopus californicus TaxID=6832 RepID=A0A553NBE8_TIGCA|nr:hypothetical protein TCAL_16575 [Tigriopus californicus]
MSQTVAITVAAVQVGGISLSLGGGISESQRGESEDLRNEQRHVMMEVACPGLVMYCLIWLSKIGRENMVFSSMYPKASSLVHPKT